MTVNGRAVADVVPHQRDAGRREFVPVAEVGRAFAAAQAPDPAAWRADLAAADAEFGSDELTDPFDRAVR